MERHVTQQGQSHHGAKLTDCQISEMKRLRSEGWSLNKLARHFGLRQAGYVSLIVRGKRRQRDAAEAPPDAPDRAGLMSFAEVCSHLDITFQAAERIEQIALAKMRRAIEREAELAGCTPLDWIRGNE